jgi:adenosine deaminase
MPLPAAVSADYLARVPKVDLHVHLEGAIRPERFVQILRRHGLHPHLREPADVAWLFQHTTFTEFLDHFRFVVTSWRDVQDVHDVALDLFRDLCAQNVAYAEVLFSAATFVRAGMPWDELLDAVGRAQHTAIAAWRRDQPHAALVPRFRCVLDLVRNFGADFAVQQAEWIATAAPEGVVGIHLGGNEAAFPARLFVDAFRIAQQAGLGLAAHAGEGDGAASVRDAIERLGVQRVGHGVRGAEDPGLVREIAARGVTLEVCPTSNQSTGVVPALAEHPLRRFLEAGVRVTIGSDDPSYFDTDTTRELRLVHEHFGVDLDGVDALVDNGLRASFQSEPERTLLLEAFAAERRALRAELGV